MDKMFIAGLFAVAILALSLYALGKDIKDVSVGKTPMLRLLDGEIVQGVVCSKFSDTNLFVVRLPDNTTWDVYDNRAEYSVGDSVVIKRIYDGQVFI